MSFAGKPPYSWSNAEVRHWITWCTKEYSLNISQSQLDTFEMNGKALLMLKRDDFCDRAPGVGDVIFNVLHHIEAEYQALICSQYTCLPVTSLLEVCPTTCTQTTTNDILFVSPDGAMSQDEVFINSQKSLSHGHFDNVLKPIPIHTRDTHPVKPEQMGSPNQCANIDDVMKIADVKLESRDSPKCLTNGGYENNSLPLKKRPRSLTTTDDNDDKFGMVHRTNVPPYQRTTNLSPTKQETLFERKLDVESYSNGRVSSTESGSSSSPHMQNLCDGFEILKANEQLVSYNPCQLSQSNHDKHLAEPRHERLIATKRLESTDNMLLWEFIHDLLEQPNCERPVRWLDQTTLTFRITDPAMLAEMWGRRKHKKNMSYEKLSRALRYYYKGNIISKVPGKKLTYRYTTHPTKIVKGIRGAKPGVPHKRRKKDGDASKLVKSKRLQKDEHVQPGILDLSLKPHEAIMPISKRRKLSDPTESSASCDSSTDMECTLKSDDNKRVALSCVNTFYGAEEEQCLDLRVPRSPSVTANNSSLENHRFESHRNGLFQSDRSAFTLYSKINESVSLNPSTEQNENHEDYVTFVLGNNHNA